MALPTFLHIPRTGGTTISAALGYPTRKDQHRPAWAYKSLDRPWTIVRDPYARLVSLCAFMHRDWLNARGRDLAVSEFEQWVRAGVRDGEFRDTLGQLANLYVDERYEIAVAAPAMDFLAPSDSRQRSGWEEPEIEIFRFEYLSDCWGDVCAHVGVDVPYPAIREDCRSRHGPVSEYFTNDYIRRATQRTYKRDFAWLAYPEMT
ncbi:MAG: sulfotransferase family protein [Gammaproteobacteria bacterium]|nr:sulfotransferase family protein [Gammaproteobacteria bacterium]